MNLLSMIFNEFSQYEFTDFFSYSGHQLPLSLLEKALNQSFYSYFQRENLLKILDYLRKLNVSHNFWRNPEIFPPIMSISMPISNIIVEQQISNLKIHLGLETDIFPPAKEQKYYRLNHLYHYVVSYNNGVRTVIKDEIFFEHDKTKIVVYYPTDGLFNDFLSKDLYPSMTEDYDKLTLIDLMNNAFTILEEYSSDIWKDFKDVISNIILTPDFSHPKRWSYNCRLSYFGGIFINPFRVNIYSMVESLIHEYYHQRMWQWWAFEDLNFFRNIENPIISPFTGEVKPASVMIHAFVIYISVLHFYSYILSNSLISSTYYTGWVINRFKTLSESIENLYLTLKNVAATEGLNQLFFDYVMDQFLTIKTVNYAS